MGVLVFRYRPDCLMHKEEFLLLFIVYFQLSTENL